MRFLILALFSIVACSASAADFTSAEELFRSIQKSQKRAPDQVCCRVCTKGKACGNSCISVRFTCHKPPGCACNG